ncbi:class I SAM-dependent methyltransferase [uncultured Parvibaculum sp.]|uniref:class I SAM-dependent methyltransferase n=1 Tax=uncultured Parvibaculum sp. TaxID=291828 RepID=UPI0030DDBA85
MSGKDTQFWDKAARKYATSPIADIAGFEKTLARTRELLSPCHRVLELGCGTGTAALRLADAVENYLATDISAQMITIANEKLASQGSDALKDGLSFRQATADTLTTEQVKYDAVLGFSYLHLAGDLPRALGNIRQMLLPGGLFISKTPCIGDMNPLVGLAIPFMRMIGKAPFSVATFSSVELEKAIREAGFETHFTERHGSKKKDIRPFIVARAP